MGFQVWMLGLDFGWMETHLPWWLREADITATRMTQNTIKIPYTHIIYKITQSHVITEWYELCQ